MYEDLQYEENDLNGGSFFTGNCTCEHSEDEHTWGGCGFVERTWIDRDEDFKVTECACQAGWEE